MQGRIIKGIAGFYYVQTEAGTYECKAKGIFRKDKKKPLVGDYVEIKVLDETAREGSVEKIYPRTNELIRPAVANIDQAIVIFAVNDPKPNFMLLDRFLVTMEYQNVPTVICFNKMDLGTKEELEILREVYGHCGYEVIFTSAAKQQGVEKLKSLLRGKTSAVAGPSGVGKSSLTNLLQNEISMETGEISKKLGRGKHTTRHSQLIAMSQDTYIMDTPGFSSLYIEGMEKEELKNCFTEFRLYEGQCKYQGCVHIHEPGCSVKAALEQGKLNSLRYEDYLGLYNELKEKRRY